jgi:hypothetical protein
MAQGRPTLYTYELCDAICARLADGESLRKICKDDAMPCKATVFKWLREQEGFSDQYAKAKEESCDALFEDIMDIADDGSNDYIESLSEEEQAAYRTNGEAIQRSKLRVDVRKWALSKIKPKKYGDKVQTEHSVSDDLAELMMNIDGSSTGLPSDE